MGRSPELSRGIDAAGTRPGDTLSVPPCRPARLHPDAPPSPGPSTLDLELDTGARAGALRILASTRGDRVFERFFAAYDAAFVLPDEKEGRDGFLACLALNEGPAHARLAARLGPFREWVVVVERDGDMVGGANFICHLGGRDAATGMPAMNLNYVFVAPGHRGRGHLRDMVAASRRVASRSLGVARSPLVFIELNDPLRMSATEYARDSRVAGVDQFDRVAIWARLGARIIDFPYLQPPLSAAQGVDDGLVLGVIGSPDPQLDACLLGRHLERFFTISVLKGRDARTLEAARGQLEACDAGCARGAGFALLDPLPHLAALREAASTARAGPPRPGLRERLAARIRDGSPQRGGAHDGERND